MKQVGLADDTIDGGSPDPSVTVVRHPDPQHRCDLPGWRRRRRLGVVVGTVVRCDQCRQHWKWLWRGWTDSGKEWVRVVPPS